MTYSYYLLNIFIFFLFLLNYCSCKGIPKKYFEPDERPTAGDLDIYLDRLNRLVRQQSIPDRLNRTDGSVVLGLVFMTSLLKRTLRDSKHKLGDKRIHQIRKILDISDNYVTHMAWLLRAENHAISSLTYVTDILANTMASFNTKLLPKYLLTNRPVNKFTSQYDDLSLPKEIYANLTMQDANREYTITADDSDECILSVNWNTLPSSADMPLRRCKASKICSELMFKDPSVSYNLSHRLINELLYLMCYRCYFRSEKEDYENFHRLCAEMYRESIYIARRGFFARDMFIEHVGVCSMGGYEEFHRRRWFLKAASFIDDFGCMQEFDNFSKNRTAASMPRDITPALKREYMQKLSFKLATFCQSHEMAVMTAMMAAAIRHAAYHLSEY